MAAFDAATAVRDDGSGGLTTDVSDAWSIGDRPNGGYLMALAAAGALHGDPHPHPLAVSAHFLRPPSAGPAAVGVSRLRAGRTVATSRVTVGQDGGAFLEALVTTGTLTPQASPEWTDTVAPALPPVADCVPGDPDVFPGRTISLLRSVHVRADPATSGWLLGDPSGRMEIRAWTRFADDREPDPLSLLLFVDALPPVTFGLGRFGWAPTVAMSVLVRAVPEPGWLRCAVRGRLVADGMFDEECGVWDSADRLVAQSRQLAAVPR